MFLIFFHPDPQLDQNVKPKWYLSRHFVMHVNVGLNMVLHLFEKSTGPQGSQSGAKRGADILEGRRVKDREIAFYFLDCQLSQHFSAFTTKHSNLNFMPRSPGF